MEESIEGNISKLHELARLEALAHFKILGTPQEERFDDLARLAKRIFNLPICLISFVGKDEIFFKANMGLGQELSEQREGSICNLTLSADGVTIFNDVHEFPNLVDNVFGVRFYAGAPLISADGYRIGTISVLGYQSMPFDERNQEILLGLAKIIMGQVVLRLVALDDERLKEDNNQLLSFNKEITSKNSDLIEFQEQITQANSDLESVQDSFEMLFERAPIAIGICSSANKVIQQANTALLQILSQNNTMIGRSIESAIPNIEGQQFLSILDEVYRSGNPFQAKEIRLLVSNDDRLRVIYVNCSFQPLGKIGDEQDNIIFILADVTEQVIASQLTDEANAVLMSAIDAGGMGYTVVDFATGELSSNAQLKHNYGFLADEQLNYFDLLETIIPKYRQYVKKAVQQAIDSNGIYRAEYEVRWKDGSTHWIQAYGKPRYDLYGRASHIVGLNKIILKPI